MSQSSSFGAADRRTQRIEDEYFNDFNDDDKALRGSSRGAAVAWYSNWIYWVKIVGLLGVLIVVAVCLGALIFDSDTFLFPIQISSFFRTGVVGSDGFPATTQETVGTIDAGLTVAFVAILAFVWLIVSIAVHDAELAQMRGGSNGWVFAFLISWNIPLSLTCALVAGVSSVMELVQIVVISLIRLFLLLLCDLLNSNGYKPTARPRLYRCIWIPYLLVLLATLALYLFIFIPLGVMYSQSAIAPSASLIAIPALALVLDLSVLIIVALYTSAHVVHNIGTRDLALYTVSILMALIFTVTSLVVFAAQSADDTLVTAVI